MSPGVELAQQVAVLSAAPALLSVTASFCPVPSVLWALISLESISSVFLAHFSHLSIFYSFLRGLQQAGKLAGEAEMPLRCCHRACCSSVMQNLLHSQKRKGKVVWSRAGGGTEGRLLATTPLRVKASACWSCCIKINLPLILAWERCS